MSLFRLIYTSTLSKNVDISTLPQIHSIAKTNNTQHGITGVLLFGNDYFLQCIEGSREEINRLFTKLARDVRHERIEISEYTETSERHFNKWSMNLVILTEKNQKTILPFSSTVYFEPYQMSSESSLKLMLHLTKE
jgi:hypothetical protein